jgi:hypothetical protein
MNHNPTELKLSLVLIHTAEGRSLGSYWSVRSLRTSSSSSSFYYFSLSFKAVYFPSLLHPQRLRLSN